MVLLTHYPSSEFTWWLYLSIHQLMSGAAVLLLAATGFQFWGVFAILMLAVLFGTYLAMRPEKYPRIGFIHAHVALIATASALVGPANMQGGLFGLSQPQVLPGDWSLLQITESPPVIALLLLLSLACLCSHIAIVRRIGV
jgi:hypothetical protein